MYFELIKRFLEMGEELSVDQLGLGWQVQFLKVVREQVFDFLG